MSAPHLNSRDISHTHWSSHISGEEQLALQQTQTHTHTTVLLTPLTHTPSLQFTPLLPTTTPTPAPLGRPSVGDGRDGLPGPPGSPGPPGIPGIAGTPGVAAIDLRYVQPPTTDTPTTVTLPTAPPPTAVTTGGEGVTYTHWGRTSCPTVDGTEDVYNGITAGSRYSHTGGSSNYICMVKEPRYRPGARTGNNWIYGTEYETGGQSLNSLDHDNVPCAACHATTRSAQLMIPETNQCPGGWTSEYTGWLMSEHCTHKGRTMYVCVDKDAQALPGLGAGNDVTLMYHTSVHCHYPGIPCPPYVHSKDLSCVVCTK